MEQDKTTKDTTINNNIAEDDFEDEEIPSDEYYDRMYQQNVHKYLKGKEEFYKKQQDKLACSEPQEKKIKK